MNWSKTIIVALSVIIGAFVIAGTKPALTQAGGGDSYMIASDGGNFAWRINRATGAVSYCIRKDSSLDEVYVSRIAPFCSAESAGMK